MVFVWPNLWHVAHCDLVVYLPNLWHVAHYDLMVYFTKYITRGSLWACVLVVQMYEMWPTGNCYQYLCFLMCWPYSFNGFFWFKKNLNILTLFDTLLALSGTFLLLFFLVVFWNFLLHILALYGLFLACFYHFFGTFCNFFSCSHR